MAAFDVQLRSSTGFNVPLAAAPAELQLPSVGGAAIGSIELAAVLELASVGGATLGSIELTPSLELPSLGGAAVGSLALTPGLELPSVGGAVVGDIAVEIDTEESDLALPSVGGAVAGSLALLVPAGVDVSHCTQGKDRLLAQFREKTKIEDLVCLFGDAAQEIEQALADFEHYRLWDVAYGHLLDHIGRNLGLPREGVTDAIYRARLEAKRRVNMSVGTGDEIVEVLTMLDAGFDAAAITLEESFPAAVVTFAHVPAGGQLEGEFQARMLKQIKAAGVKLIHEFEETDVDLFEWDGSPTGAGWGVGIWSEAV